MHANSYLLSLSYVYYIDLLVVAYQSRKLTGLFPVVVIASICFLATSKLCAHSSAVCGSLGQTQTPSLPLTSLCACKVSHDSVVVIVTVDSCRYMFVQCIYSAGNHWPLCVKYLLIYC